MILRPRSLLPLAAAAALVAPLFVSSPADAGVRIHIGGGVRVSGHVRVGGPRVHARVHRPHVVRYHPRRLRIGGSIYFGGGAYFGTRFAEPPPPPCDCDGGPSMAPAYYPGVQTPAAVYVAPALPRFGLGVAAGQLETKGGVAGSDLALLAHLRLTRSGSLELEGEVAKTALQDSTRIDRRIGGALIWNLTPRNRLVPYLLGGMGVTQVDMADDWTTDQKYGELGVGLTYKVSPRLQIGADFRAGSRTDIEHRGRMPTDGLAREIAPPANEPEQYTRGRLSAMLYF